MNYPRHDALREATAAHAVTWCASAMVYGVCDGLMHHESALAVTVFAVVMATFQTVVFAVIRRSRRAGALAARS